MRTNPMSLGAKKRPTQKHRPAIWECMLGTVYAMNDAGEIRYFDYKWEDAVAYAGVTPDRDPRVHRFPADHGRVGNGSYTNQGQTPRVRQFVLWVRS